MFRTRVYRGYLFASLYSLIVMGCGDGQTQSPTGEVEGTVTLDGEPLTEGGVSFYHSETGGTGGAELGAGGKFKLDLPLPVGEYQVSFVPPQPPQPDDEASGKKANDTSIHDRYRDGSTSGIVKEIKEGPNNFTLELTKEGPPETE